MSINFKIFARKNGGQFAPESGGQFDRFMQWNKKEYKEVESQFAVFKDQFMPSFISDYTYIDEYDEDNCDEE